MCSPLQFHFQCIIGYELKKSSAALKVATESVVIQTNCGKDANKIRGPVEHCPQKPNTNNFDDREYENIWKIFGKYLYISNAKFTVKGCREEIVVFWLFSKQDLKFLHAKFQVPLTSPFSFLPKNA